MATTTSEARSPAATESGPGEAGDAAARSEPGGEVPSAASLREVGKDPDASSLRVQLLLGMALLLTVALMAVAVAGLFWLPAGRSTSDVLTGLMVLILVDVGVLLVFGDYLLRRLVLEPVEEMAAGAEQIAGGDHEHRLAPSGPTELRRLARSVNRMADRLIQNQRELAKNIESLDETNRALTEAKNELVRAEKLATVGRLAAGVAHEVGNPLSSVMGYVELARRKGHEEEEWLEGIAHEAGRIDRIVRGLLDYARPKEGDRRPVDANDVVERSVALLEDQGRFKSVEVLVEGSPDEPQVAADPSHLEQVLVNLLLNATDAIEDAGGDGQVRVTTSVETVDRPSRLVRRRPRREDDPAGADYSHLRRLSKRPSEIPTPLFGPDQKVVAIRVEDDGVGIDEERSDELFDPFYTTKDPGRGTGLGLAVSARLVEGMDGTIEARSRDEGGSMFSVLLPMAEAES